MRLNNTLVLIFGCTLFLTIQSSILSAQQMERTGRWDINYNDHQYDYRKMNDIFATAPRANHWYQKSMKSYKAARTTEWVALGIAGSGVIFMAIDDEDVPFFATGDGLLAPSDALGITLTFLVAPLTGVVSLVIRGAGKRQKKKAIIAFNESNLGYHPLEVEEELSFGPTQNGLGFVYRF